MSCAWKFGQIYCGIQLYSCIHWIILNSSNMLFINIFYFLFWSWIALIIFILSQIAILQHHHTCEYNNMWLNLSNNNQAFFCPLCVHICSPKRMASLRFSSKTNINISGYFHTTQLHRCNFQIQCIIWDNYV